MVSWTLSVNLRRVLVSLGKKRPTWLLKIFKSDETAVIDILLRTAHSFNTVKKSLFGSIKKETYFFSKNYVFPYINLLLLYITAAAETHTYSYKHKKVLL